MWQGQVARISIQIDYIDDLDLQVGSPEKVDFPVLVDAKSSTIFLKNDVPILNHSIFRCPCFNRGFPWISQAAPGRWYDRLWSSTDFYEALPDWLPAEKGATGSTWTQEVQA